MAKWWEKAGKAALGLAGGGIVGGVLAGWGEDIQDAYQRNLQAETYKFDPEAFQDPRAEQNRAMLQGRLAGIEGRGMDDPFRQGQLTLAEQLAAQARGEGPSLAQMQLREGTDRNLAQALAMQATAGGNPALAQRGIAQQRSDIGQQAAMQSGQTAMQEQMIARQQLAGVLGQGRAGEQQQMALNDQMVRHFIDAGLSIDEAQFAANMELERLRGQQSMAVNLGNVQANAQMFGGLLNMGGTAATALL